MAWFSRWSRKSPSSGRARGRPRGARRSRHRRPSPAPRRAGRRPGEARPSSARTRGSLRSRIPRGCSSSTSASRSPPSARPWPGRASARRGTRRSGPRRATGGRPLRRARGAGFDAGGDRLPPGARGETLADERARESVSPSLEHAERISDCAEKNAKPGRPARPRTRTTAPGRRAAARDVAPEDPGMTRTHAALAAFADYDRQVGHRAIVSSSPLPVLESQ